MSPHRAIDVEPLTPTGFAPFGTVLGPLEARHELASEPTPLNPHRMLELPLEVLGTPALYLIRYPRQAMVATRFERHLAVTEARIALRDPVVFVAGGEPTATPPEPEAIRAFLIPGGGGIVLGLGVWHAATCFPVRGEHADLVFLSERELERELASGEASPVKTQIHDFAAEGIGFEIRDPDGLLRTANGTSA